MVLLLLALHFIKVVIPVVENVRLSCSPTWSSLWHQSFISKLDWAKSTGLAVRERLLILSHSLRYFLHQWALLMRRDLWLTGSYPPFKLAETLMLVRQRNLVLLHRAYCASTVWQWAHLLGCLSATHVSDSAMLQHQRRDRHATFVIAWWGLLLSWMGLLAHSEVAEDIVFLTASQVAVHKSIECRILIPVARLRSGRARAGLRALKALEVVLELLLVRHVLCCAARVRRSCRSHFIIYRLEVPR